MNNKTKIILLGISVSLLMAGCNNMTEAKKNVTVSKEKAKNVEGALYMQSYVDWFGNKKTGPLSELSVIELEKLAEKEDMAGLLDAGKEVGESSEEPSSEEQETQPKEVAIEESGEKETEAVAQEKVTETTEEVTTESETTEEVSAEEATTEATTEAENTEEATTEDVTQESSEENAEDKEPVKPNGLVAPFSVSFLGDSITVGYYSDFSYADVVCNDLNLAKYNYGKSGNTVASEDGDGFVERYRGMHPSELIVVYGGSNDYYNSIPMGRAPSNNKEEFYGALNIMCSGLKATYPNSRIVYLTPLPGAFEGKYNSGNNDAGYSMADYVFAIKDVCGKNAIDVIDMFNGFTITNNNFDEYTSDGLHPNEAGHKAIAQALESYIKSLM